MNNGTIIQKNLSKADRLCSIKSKQGMLHVFELFKPHLRFLFIGPQLASCLSLDPLEPGFPHLKEMAKFFKKVPRKGSVVILGHGAGVLPLFALMDPKQLKVTSVDFEPLFFSLAQEYFFLKPSKRLTLVDFEAEAFLKQLKIPCDLLLVDLFTKAEEVPRKFKTEKLIRLYYDSLEKGGIACFNYIGHPTKRKEFELIKLSFKKVFGNCRVIFTEEHSSKLHQNILFIGKR